MKAPGSPPYLRLKGLMRDLNLHTVCEEARCPNIGECWTHGTATFMILGDICTRACGYCAVGHGRPHPVDMAEPARVADAVASLDLAHVVVTLFDRDDVPDGGASIFAETIRAIRRRTPGASIEVLIPDFQGKAEPLHSVLDPRALTSSITTPKRCPGSISSRGRAADTNALWSCSIAPAPTLLEIATKSGIMLGLGEEWDEILATLTDLRTAGCAILTLGQSLRPSPAHLPHDPLLPSRRVSSAEGHRAPRGIRARGVGTARTGLVPRARTGRCLASW